jgi:predicted 3-demethylubiquinone-9 3-methyltransferase (glyoxalase superfamily)
MVLCRDQAEIDNYWGKLSFVPEAEQCGWIKDTFGISWQIIPEGMGEMLNNPDTEKANKAMEAMLQMKKIDIAKLQRASK